MAECRSCKAEIRWAVTQKGRRIPLDLAPREDGNLEIVDSGGPGRDPVVRTLLAGEQVLPGLEVSQRYVSHFATCPDADLHRNQ